MGLLELDDLVRAGEAHFDESRLAQGAVHLHGPVKRRRAVRAVASSAGTAGAVGLGALAGYGISVVEDPVAPPAKYASDAPREHKTLEQALLTGVPWTEGAEGQRFAWCNLGDSPAGSAEAVFREPLDCDHLVIPDVDLLEVEAELHLTSNARTAIISYEVTNTSGRDFDIITLAPVVTSVADPTLTVKTEAIGDAGRSVWGSAPDVAPLRILEPLYSGDYAEPFRAGTAREGVEQYAVNGIFARQSFEVFAPESMKWIDVAISNPDSIRLSMVVRVARSELSEVDEVTLYNVDIGDVYLDRELMYEAPR